MKLNKDNQKYINTNASRLMAVAKNGLLLPGKNEADLYDKNSKSINNAFDQRVTAAEVSFREQLFKMLRAAGFTGIVGCQHYIVTPAKRKLKIPKRINSKKYKEVDVEYAVLRPDIIFHQHGLVIEIDGNIHDRNEACSRRDAFRVSDYHKLGFTLWVIPNEDAMDYGTKIRLIKKIISYLKEVITVPNFKTISDRRRKIVNDYRRHYIDAIKAGKRTKNNVQDIGNKELPGTQKVYNEYLSIRSARAWGGVNYHFGKKSKKMEVK